MPFADVVIPALLGAIVTAALYEIGERGRRRAAAAEELQPLVRQVAYRLGDIMDDTRQCLAIEHEIALLGQYEAVPFPDRFSDLLHDTARISDAAGDLARQLDAALAQMAADMDGSLFQRKSNEITARRNFEEVPADAVSVSWEAYETEWRIWRDDLAEVEWLADQLARELLPFAHGDTAVRLSAIMDPASVAASQFRNC